MYIYVSTIPPTPPIANYCLVEFHTTRYYWGLREALYYVGIVQRQTFGTLYSF